MDEELKELLRVWGTPQPYQAKIEEEVFNVATLLNLEDSELNSIFPKAGPRGDFKAKLKNLKAQKISRGNLSSHQDVTTQPMRTATLNIETSACDVIDANLDSLGSGASPSHVPATSPAQSICQSEEERPNSGSRVRIVPNITSIGSKRRNELAVTEETPIKKLCANSGVNGKIVLNIFKERGRLDDESRTLLAEVVLNDYLKNDYTRRFPECVEQELAQQILKDFPGENKEFWVSSFSCKRNSAVGRGKLLTRYYSIGRVMRKNGLLKKNEDEDEGESNIDVDDLAILDEDDDTSILNEKLLWLTNNRMFSTKLSDYWRDTSKGRMRRMITPPKTKVEEYMHSYPALRENHGFTLLEIDFETLYRGKSVSLYVEWPMLAAFIESKVPRRIKEEINAALTPEGKKIKTIQALPFLFNVVTVGKKTKQGKQWKPSREESGEALVLHATTIAEMLTKLNNRVTQHYEKFGLELGPQAVVIGPCVDSITHYYVRVNGVNYEVDNALKAVDMAFKILHALDCKYPKECQREWFFFERAVYGMNPGKRNTLTTATSSIRSDYESSKSLE